MNEKSQHRISIENHLRCAIEKKEIFTVYQPLINLSSEKIVGAEALIRWHNPRYGPVPPGVFIPIAEDIGLINQLGAHVLSNACQEAVKWHQSGHRLWVAVNLSPRQLKSADFMEKIGTTINLSGLDSSYLELEVTENCLLEDVEIVKSHLQQLDSRNIRLAIDDFGTGYSSLSYLKKFPFQRLKIDRSFMTDLPHDPETASLVRTILAIAQGLGLKAIAEGVETKEQLNFLKDENCDYAQGYLFSPPLSASGFRKLLSKTTEQSREKTEVRSESR
jgi:EAL domain-containing protein (putative c-di-GMP-specific phosphodiesterase class I)